MRLIEYRGEVLSGYAPGLPQIAGGRSEMLRPVLMLKIQKKGLKTMLVEVKRINKAEVTVANILDVAETFGKQHAHVLRDIKELECSEEFRLSNFGESKHIDPNSEMYIKRGIYEIYRRIVKKCNTLMIN